MNGILDLYKKEKEKNKDLSKRYDLMQLCYENDISNSISKDKIREKIEKIIYNIYNKYEEPDEILEDLKELEKILEE